MFFSEESAKGCPIYVPCCIIYNVAENFPKGGEEFFSPVLSSRECTFRGAREGIDMELVGVDMQLFLFFLLLFALCVCVFGVAFFEGPCCIRPPPPLMPRRCHWAEFVGKAGTSVRKGI